MERRRKRWSGDERNETTGESEFKLLKLQDG
jgi:hypothetical protein